MEVRDFFWGGGSCLSYYAYRNVMAAKMVFVIFLGRQRTHLGVADPRIPCLRAWYDHMIQHDINDVSRNSTHFGPVHSNRKLTKKKLKRNPMSTINSI